VAALYPPIEPFETGMLDVGDGNLVYYEVCGNPEGKPAAVVHGGPGSGCTAGQREYFDPDRYRVVLLDQRGCGRSRPHATRQRRVPARSAACQTDSRVRRLGTVPVARNHVTPAVNQSAAADSSRASPQRGLVLRPADVGVQDTLELPPVPALDSVQRVLHHVIHSSSTARGGVAEPQPPGSRAGAH
jgi:hypothetical protein